MERSFREQGRKGKKTRKRKGQGKKDRNGGRDAGGGSLGPALRLSSIEFCLNQDFQDLFCDSV